MSARRLAWLALAAVACLAAPAAAPAAEGASGPYAPLAPNGHAWARMTEAEKLRYLEGFLAGRALAQAAERGTTVEALRRARQLAFPFAPTVYKTRLEDFFFYRDRRDMALHEAVAAVNEQLKGGPGAAPSPARPRTRRFGGEVARGQLFESPMAGDLLLRLVPTPERDGWEIGVGTRRSAGCDFARVATPPFRGLNDRYIEGWHFRNADNTGPNEPGPKNVNAPQTERWFRFVLTEADCERARATLERRLWPASGSPEEEAAAARAHEAIETGEATLRITALRLGNLEPGKRPWIDAMTFEVEVHLPPGTSQARPE